MQICAYISTLATCWLVAGGCAGSVEQTARGDFSRLDDELRLRAAPKDVPAFDGTLNGYLGFALEHSPGARASFERWRAATLRITEKRRLPEPSLSFGYFVRSVETRVGPQRFKIGLSQTFPWPSKLSASADAAAERARAAHSVFDAALIRVRHRVAVAYWRLWLIHEQHRLKTEHDAVLESLAEAVRGRVRTGAATLADLSQIELNIARHHDHRGEHVQLGRKASAEMLAALGVSAANASLTATDAPRVGLPGISDAELLAAARAHPRIERHAHLASSERSVASAKRADGYPRIRLGLDYIDTDSIAGMADSGKDPLIVSAGISIPLWRGNYSDAERAAQATASAHDAEREAALRDAEVAVETALANVRDSERRIGLYDGTLLPQAQTTFQAVIGSYQTGRSNIAAVILAQRDLLDLQLQHATARAEHATAWSRLELVVGRPVDFGETDGD